MARTVLAAGALAIVGTPQLAAAATTVASDSTALDVNLTVLNLITANVATALASGTAAPAYNTSNNLLSLNTTVGLNLGSLVTTASDGPNTNAITDTASSTYPALLSGTATSTVNGLSSNLSLVSALVNLLSISATTLTSTSTAAKPGGTLNLTGTSLIEDLTVTDGIVGLGGSTVTVNAGALASTPVNDLILSAAGLNVYTNYQTPVVNGGVTDGINTAALAIKLNNFAFGTGLLSGTILFADSQASIAAVPEPGTWAMMLFGFALTGAVIRRKQGLTPVLA